MDNAQTTYTSFFNVLKESIDQLKSALTSEAPEALGNVEVVTKIIKPESSAFSNNEAETVISRIFLTMAVTKRILGNISQFVNPDSQEWFTAEKGKLDFYMMSMNMALGTLRLENADCELDEDSGGIGGLNTGIHDSLDSDVLIQIKDLVDALKS